MEKRGGVKHSRRQVVMSGGSDGDGVGDGDGDGATLLGRRDLCWW